LKLEDIFKAYEEESYKRISGLIAAVDTTVIAPAVFTLFMDKIYKRSK